MCLKSALTIGLLFSTFQLYINAEYILDTIGDVDTQPEWGLDCSGGYHPAQEGVCLDRNTSLIPEADYNGNTGFWAACFTGGNPLPLCELNFTVTETTKDVNQVAVLAYFTGPVSLRILGRKVGQVGFSQIAVVTENKAWTDPNHFYQIEESLLPLEEVKVTLEYLWGVKQAVIVDKIIIVDSSYSPVPTTTTTNTTVEPTTTTVETEPTTTPTTVTETEPITTSTTANTTVTTTPHPTTTITTTTRPCGHAQCPPFVDGNYPDPMDCTGYIACTAGAGVCRSCNPGLDSRKSIILYYNIEADQCDYPENVDCGTRPIP